ncbi:MAG TPA: haloacid dehalogenase type II [Thermomicrobiales bacterium]|nr:haloacid dehalogenase type II [Thermomicrobiales bacterium]
MLDYRRYSTFTFDCYGTLIDWETGILNALRPVLQRHGLSLTDDQILEQFGELESTAELPPYRTYRDVLSTVVEGFGARLGFTATDDDRAALSESVGDWPAFPDTAEALQRLARRHRLVIISNVDDDLFARSALRLPVAFHDVITAQQVGSYKPNLDNFHFALRKIDTPVEDVLHVAQSLFHDMEPANKIGLTTVWINRRHDRPGFGTTPPASATPVAEFPDLKSFADQVDAAHAAAR